MTKVTTLRDATRELLIHRPASISINDIADEIGVSAAWLRLFARGKIEHPSVVHVETLNEFLKKHKK